LLSRVNSVGPYFEIIIQSSSEYAPGVKSSFCVECGYEILPEEDRPLVMSDSMWRGTDVFFLGETLFVGITDKMKLALDRLGATNVTFVPLEVPN